ncbi:MAG: hypothetical protein MJ239_06070 [Bacilli bacterium]|nr:hypothetical protein [Bacilli bacterium]
MVQVFLFQGDLCFVEAIHNELDAVALTASYKISMCGYVSEELREFVRKEAKAEIYTVTPSASFGEALTFSVYRDYRPFVISKENMRISVTRTAIVGYFN